MSWMTAVLHASLAPIRPTLYTVRHYNLHKLRKDLLAGATVAVVEVPQAMAYALVAGVPPEYGIYTSILQGFLGALMSSSEHVTTGPTNTQSLLIAATVQRLVGDPGNPMYLELVFALTMMKGLIQLGFAFLRMGNVTRYVSRSVIVGVMAGAGVLILAGQLANFLGVPRFDGHAGLPGVLGDVQRLLPHLDQINPRAVLVGVLCLAIIVGMRRISRFLPGALTAIISAAILVWAMGWNSGQVPLIPPLPSGLPKFHLPQFNVRQAESMMAGAFALAIIGILESVAIAKSIATHTGERIDANQEFLTQGLKNAITSFFQCIPGSASFTRSALDYEAGAETRFAAVFNALFVAVIFLLFSAQAALIPLAALAAVLFVIAFGLIDWRHLAGVARVSRSDAAVCYSSFLATMLLPLQYAIFVGITLNLALFLRRAGQLHITQMVSTSTGAFVEQPVHEQPRGGGVLFLQVEGELFFGVADELQDRLTMVTANGLRVVVLRLKRTHSIDSTVLAVLDQFAQQLHARGGHLLLCGVKPELMQVLGDYGLVRRIGPENVFPTENGIFSSARHALERAAVLANEPLETTALEKQETSEAWAFDI